MPRLIADLLGASVSIWVIWNLLRKQHKLRGAARILRWIMVIFGIAVFEASEHAWFNVHWGVLSLGAVGFLAACFFFVFPDISFYLVTGYEKLRTGRGPSA